MLISSIILAATLQASPVQPLLDNALEVSSDAGSYITYFNADGTYTTNVGISGTWHVEGDELCAECRDRGHGDLHHHRPRLDSGGAARGFSPTAPHTRPSPSPLTAHRTQEPPRPDQ